MNLQDVPEKYRRLINKRRKVFGLIFIFHSVLNNTNRNLDFETKILQIR